MLQKYLIELLSYIIEVLEQNKIVYFLDYGSLLGCVRNQSFIPWDTDIDISIIHDENIDKIMNIVKNNDKKYNLVKSSDNFYRLNYSYINKLHVDISIRKKEKDKIYTDKYNKQYWGIHENDLFPLKSTTFENICVKIPKNSKTYLEQGYGKECITNPKTKRGNDSYLKTNSRKNKDYTFFKSRMLKNI